MMKVGVLAKNVTNEMKLAFSGVYDKDVIIEKDVWIGSNVTILKRGDDREMDNYIFRNCGK